LAPKFRVLDPTGLDDAGLARELAAANPEVLVACWKTPLLPEQLPADLRYVCYIAGSLKRVINRSHLERGLLVTNWGGSISRTVAECALFHSSRACATPRTGRSRCTQPGKPVWKNGITDVPLALLPSRRHPWLRPRRARTRHPSSAPWNCPITALAPDLTPPSWPAPTASSAPRRSTRSSPRTKSSSSSRRSFRPRPTASTSACCASSGPGGVFVNVGRGAVVDEGALLKVAREGKIAVGLDVYNTVEPLAADKRLPRAAQREPHAAHRRPDHRSLPPDAGAFALKNLRAYAEKPPARGCWSRRRYTTRRRDAAGSLRRCLPRHFLLPPAARIEKSATRARSPADRCSSAARTSNAPSARPRLAREARVRAHVPPPAAAPCLRRPRKSRSFTVALSRRSSSSCG